MGTFDIVLLLIGATLIVISFLIVEKLSEGESNGEVSYHDPEEFNISAELVKRQLEEYLEKAKEATIDSVNDSLCHLSNEKIMSVSEYADMVLDRIDKNHSEVVFLYGMLNDKEKELKQMCAYSHNREEKETINDKESELKVEDTHTPSLSVSQAAKVEIAMMNYEEKNDERKQYEALQKEIFELLEQGKSVAEIARTLGIGQGEVQLIVNVCMEDSL